MEEKSLDLDELIYDDLNFSKGTLRGKVLLDRSFDKFGAGRSILIDKNNCIIAGNKSVKSAMSNGIGKCRVIETQGDELVAVRRVDIDLSSTEGREFALADNATAKANFSLDYNKIMQAVEDVKLDAEAWGIKDLDKLVEKSKESKKTKVEKREEDKKKFIFKRYSIPMTDEEYEQLINLVDEYFDDYGVVVGFIGNLLNI